jgi:RHS repeat-associated protein
VRGVRYIDDCVLRDRDTNADGTFDERLFVLQDANWNITSLAGGGSIQERLAYSPYGMPLWLSPTFTPDGPSYQWEYLFTAHRYLNEVGILVARNRLYVPLLGVFTSRDSLIYVDGMALYQYVSSHPINLYDPSGTCSIGKYVTQFCDTKCIGSAFYVQCMSERDSGLTLEEKFMMWYNGELKDLDWTKNLPGRPCSKDSEEALDRTKWSGPGGTHGYHVGATCCIRSVVPSGPNHSGEQCCYDSAGNLITTGSGVASSDRVNSGQWWTEPTNFQCDVHPASMATALDDGGFGEFRKLYLKLDLIITRTIANKTMGARIHHRNRPD